MTSMLAMFTLNSKSATTVQRQSYLFIKASCPSWSSWRMSASGQAIRHSGRFDTCRQGTFERSATLRSSAVKRSQMNSQSARDSPNRSSVLEQRDLCPTPLSAWRTTVKASDRERVFNDLFRTYGDIRLELAAERDIPQRFLLSFSTRR